MDPVMLLATAVVVAAGMGLMQWTYAHQVRALRELLACTNNDPVLLTDPHVRDAAREARRLLSMPSPAVPNQSEQKHLNTLILGLKAAMEEARSTIRGWQDADRAALTEEIANAVFSGNVDALDPDFWRAIQAADDTALTLSERDAALDRAFASLAHSQGGAE